MGSEHQIVGGVDCTRSDGWSDPRGWGPPVESSDGPSFGQEFRNNRGETGIGSQ